ncbi:hypothetical protein A5773_04220 [Mycobacterium sp. 852014-52450_SCH5900713]|uniref:hypothetical protein n=1 Tax=Mycobacterium sp. 852014-52450_SCH5900713 TaxID=1834116 RepID=UPI0008003828|nr:hypothetical protein [Mycobacterium sp. 852014-52450_SCH5900713]OBG00700.1 hypothetical protein A5773_04220 [Mycobacterium sp. 852014-52450_SCH5900713]
MSALTKRDVIDAAMSVAEDVAESRLDPTQLNQAVADECKALFGTVVGDDDPLWPLHIDVARQVLAVGGLSADELSEWLAVASSRAEEPISSPQPPIDPPAGTSAASRPRSPEIDLAESDLSTAVVGVVTPPGAETGPVADPPAADTNASPMVELPDGRRIPRRHIIARGRELPTDNGLREC